MTIKSCFDVLSGNNYFRVKSTVCLIMFQEMTMLSYFNQSHSKPDHCSRFSTCRVGGSANSENRVYCKICFQLTVTENQYSCKCCALFDIIKQFITRHGCSKYNENYGTCMKYLCTVDIVEI